MLKEELRSMDRSRKREGVDMTYLKNVVLKLLETGTCIRLLCTNLHLWLFKASIKTQAYVVNIVGIKNFIGGFLNTNEHYFGKDICNYGIFSDSFLYQNNFITCFLLRWGGGFTASNRNASTIQSRWGDNSEFLLL